MMLFIVKNFKIGFLFSVNVYVFITMKLFIVKNVKTKFLFSVNVYVFIPMMLLIVKNRVFILVLMYMYLLL